MKVNLCHSHQIRSFDDISNQLLLEAKVMTLSGHSKAYVSTTSSNKNGWKKKAKWFKVGNGKGKGKGKGGGKMDPLEKVQEKEQRRDILQKIPRILRRYVYRLLLICMLCHVLC